MKTRVIYEERLQCRVRKGTRKRIQRYANKVVAHESDILRRAIEDFMDKHDPQTTEVA